MVKYLIFSYLQVALHVSGSKVAAVGTCLSQYPTPPLKGAIRAYGLSIAARLSLPANPGPASDDALFGTRGRRLQSRRAWSSRGLLVAGHDHFCQA